MIWPSSNTSASNEPGFLIIYFAFSASYFSSYSFPCEYYVLITTKKKSRRYLIFDNFRMMAAQVQIEMVLAIQGKLQLNPTYVLGQKSYFTWGLF